MRAYQSLGASALALALCLGGAARPAVAAGVVDVEVSGNQLSATVSLAGSYLVDVEITFEEVSGLDLSQLSLSARVLSPLDLLFRSRLPGGVLTTPALPVVLSIEPRSSSTLAFEGIYSIDLHTHNLVYLPSTPLRLFKAPRGGKFEDVTEAMGVGSYRVRGSGGCFSDFLIVLDLRSIASVISGKYDDLEDTLADNAGSIPAATHAELTGLLSSSRDAYAAGDFGAAVAYVESFAETVEANSGAGGIPDVWQANTALVNVAGNLRAQAGTLRFSLILKMS